MPKAASRAGASASTLLWDSAMSGDLLVFLFVGAFDGGRRQQQVRAAELRVVQERAVVDGQEDLAVALAPGRADPGTVGVDGAQRGQAGDPAPAAAAGVYLKATAPAPDCLP